jgi:8-oxo-dGTP pyrophosphatase MutT (NUDIX family)
LTETPFQIARREAYEEIGLPLDESKLPSPFRIEHICQLPFNLAKTELAVRPCVAFLHSESGGTDAGADADADASDASNSRKSANVEETMIPRLDAKEVAAVFSAPFHNFLRDVDEPREGERIPGKKEDWYQGAWTEWHESQWRIHNFYVPINNQMVTKPRVREGDQKAIAERLEEDPARYKVWGMTARILVDAARLAYGEDPTFEVCFHPPLYYMPSRDLFDSFPKECETNSGSTILASATKG